MLVPDASPTLGRGGSQRRRNISRRVELPQGKGMSSIRRTSRDPRLHLQWKSDSGESGRLSPEDYEMFRISDCRSRVKINGRTVCASRRREREGRRYFAVTDAAEQYYLIDTRKCQPAPLARGLRLPNCGRPWGLTGIIGRVTSVRCCPVSEVVTDPRTSCDFPDLAVR